MQEAFIHFVWKHQYFNKTNLCTTEGQAVNVLKPGFYNTDSGPDFKEARLIIDDLEWRGSVEIHHRSSDWTVHNHTNDKAYDNVVLHIVWHYDEDVKRSDGTVIPTVELFNRVDSNLLDSYKSLINSLQPIPCAEQLTGVDDLVIASMVDKMTIERLYEKAELISVIFERTGNDWEATSFQLLAKNFGFKTNSEPFQRLAELLPVSLLSKHNNQLLQLEALLFGQAGFLTQEIKDSYYGQLKKEYKFLAHKYDLPEPISVFQWKFMRLRPANFPTLRIAQLAAVMRHQHGLFSRIKEVSNLEELKSLFKRDFSSYWHEHYRFGKKTQSKVHEMGLSSIQNIGINTVAPILVAYGITLDQQQYIDQAVELLQSLNAENNKITKLWKSLEVNSDSAFESQGLIQLYNSYCSKKRCLNCNIGIKLLQRQ